MCIASPINAMVRDSSGIEQHFDCKTDLARNWYESYPFEGNVFPLFAHQREKKKNEFHDKWELLFKKCQQSHSTEELLGSNSAYANSQALAVKIDHYFKRSGSGKRRQNIPLFTLWLSYHRAVIAKQNWFEVETQLQDKRDIFSKG